jgi:hypothetical protein
MVFMKTKMLSRRGTLLGVGAFLVARAARAQDANWYVPSVHADEVREGRDCLIVADRRVFTVMAFINASGFDELASNGEPMHPTRMRTRALIAERLRHRPAALARYRAAYARFALSNADYLEYAITLTPDYPFAKVGPDDHIFHDYTAMRLTAFPALLNEFWRTARIDRVWRAIKPDYLADMQRYDLARMTGDLDFVWRYVRMPRREARTMVNTPNLLDRQYSAISVPCGRYFVSIEAPGSHNYGLNIHEYLHEIVNPETARNYETYRANLEPHFARWMAFPNRSGYDVPVAFVQECLVRALDARVTTALYPQRGDAKRREVESAVAQGFSLTRPFYDGLAAFDAQRQGFDAFVPIVFAAIAR